ncbi:MAG TPA: MerR family transcriptional regulator [Solirubrobacterales bacterium]|jgi:MerR family transcriptional regulator/heat shock protein HspR
MATYRRRVKATFDEEQGVFMISVAAELAEMHPQTLRMYEQRGLIAPKRSPKNTRLYSQRDVERLRRIQEMTAQGLNLVGVETVLALEAQVAKLKRRVEELEGKGDAADAG